MPVGTSGESILVLRRGPGKKSKNAKMAAVGVLYTLRRDAEGKLDGPVNKRVYGTFEGYRAVFKWIALEAKKRGYGTPKFTKVLFVADGADAIWALQQEFFPYAEVCLDWYHVVGEALGCRQGGLSWHAAPSRRARSWVAAQKKRLRQGKVEEVIAEIQRAFDETAVTGPGNKYRREVLGKVRDHFAKNAARMQYAKLRAADLESEAASSKGPSGTSSVSGSTVQGCGGAATAPKQSSTSAACSSTACGTPSPATWPPGWTSASAPNPFPRGLTMRP